MMKFVIFCFFFSSRRRHTRSTRDWSSDVCSSDLLRQDPQGGWKIRCYLWRSESDRKLVRCIGCQGRARLLGLRFSLHNQVEIGRASCREECRYGCAAEFESDEVEWRDCVTRDDTD